MLLTRLVDAWGRSANRSHLRLDPSEPALVPATLAEAYGLAGDLAALLDQMQTEGVAIDRLAKLDAARFDRIWQLNASFLSILGAAWPAILAERGACDPADFRNRMLAAERERLLAGAATGPDHRRRFDRHGSRHRSAAGRNSAGCRTAPSCCPASISN